MMMIMKMSIMVFIMIMSAFTKQNTPCSMCLLLNSLAPALLKCNSYWRATKDLARHTPLPLASLQSSVGEKAERCHQNNVGVIRTM